MMLLGRIVGDRPPIERERGPRLRKCAYRDRRFSGEVFYLKGSEIDDGPGCWDRSRGPFGGEGILNLVGV
jgi:hypothetical protein